MHKRIFEEKKQEIIRQMEQLPNKFQASDIDPTVQRVSFCYASLYNTRLTLGCEDVKCNSHSLLTRHLRTPHRCSSRLARRAKTNKVKATVTLTRTGAFISCLRPLI